MKSIAFIAQFPPPIHGLSKAVETLYHSRLKDKYAFLPINITDNSHILSTLWKIWKSRCELYYFTISQTKGGNLRDLLILSLLRVKRARCVIHLHGGYYRQLIERECSAWQRRLNYRALREVEGAIVLGESLKYIFKGMLDARKIHVVPNCVDNQYVLGKGQFLAKEERLKVCRDIHVLYLSNFIPSKGYGEVLALAAMAKTREDKWLRFHFAGKFYGHKEENDFFDYVSQNGLGEYVTYHGVVSGNDKRALLESCHVFVLLTRYPNEGQPISILEAMGNAMVVITTNHAGIPDITENQVSGLVVDKSDIRVASVYEYLRSLFMDREKLVSVAAHNYHSAITLYSEDKYIQRMDDIFQQS